MTDVLCLCFDQRPSLFQQVSIVTSRFSVSCAEMCECKFGRIAAAAVFAVPQSLRDDVNLWRGWPLTREGLSMR
jgi:hypothetical protein